MEVKRIYMVGIGKDVKLTILIALILLSTLLVGKSGIYPFGMKEYSSVGDVILIETNLSLWVLAPLYPIGYLGVNLDKVAKVDIFLNIWSVRLFSFIFLYYLVLSYIFAKVVGEIEKKLLTRKITKNDGWG